MPPITRVFVVPGITGSVLYLRYLNFTRSLDYEVWPSVASVLQGAFGKMTLTVEGEEGGNPPGYLTGGGPIPSYYGGWYNEIRRIGSMVPATIVQDWRREWVYDGAVLADAIRTITDDFGNPRPVCGIIAHSRGGLVTRWALELLRRTGDLDRVRTVFGLGVPHRGSLNAVDNLNGPWDYATDLHKLGNLVGSLTLGLVSYASVQGALRSWPGLYELIPDPLRTWLDPSEVARLYEWERWPVSAYGLVKAHLLEAKASWAALPDPPAEVEWVNVVGVGFPTRVGAPTADEMIGHDSVVSPDGGDGVVPVESAKLPGRATLYTATAHGAMAYDPKLMSQVMRIMRGGGAAVDGFVPGDPLDTPEGTTEGPGG